MTDDSLFPPPEPRPLPVRARPRDFFWEAFMEACGIQSADLTIERRKVLNGMLRGLKRFASEPEEITRRAANCPWGIPTPEQLVRHWAEWWRAPAPPRKQATSVQQGIEVARRLREGGR